MPQVIKDGMDQVLRLIGGKQKEAEEHFIRGTFAPGHSPRWRGWIGWVVFRIIEDRLNDNFGTSSQAYRSFVIVLVLPVVIPPWDIDENYWLFLWLDRGHSH